MRRLILLIVGCSVISWTSAQTVCTVTASGNWPSDGTGLACAEGGDAFGEGIVRIPAGITITFGNSDTWTGTRFEVFGTLDITQNVTINSNIIVKQGGILIIDKRLTLGTAVPGCAFFVAVANGGKIDVLNKTGDELVICGTKIMEGNTVPGTSCNNCGGAPNQGRCAYAPTNLPYCEPTVGAGGFTGQTAYDRNGYNIALPIKLLDFTAESELEKVNLQWATSMEENFHKFIIEKSNDGLTFESIGEVPGKGFNIYDVVSEYAFEDEAPLLGFNYYRLKAIDLDGTFDYSGVKAVKLNGSKKLAVFPNPSTGEVISFRTNFSPSESDRIVILNQLGVEIFNGHASTSQNQISMEGKLRAGIYMLRYVSKDFEQTARVLVKH